MLTTMQLKTLRFIIGRIDATGGVSPTLREIATHLGHRSMSGVSRVLEGLEARGWISRRSHRGRSITVLKRPPAPKAVHELAQAILDRMGVDETKDDTELMIVYRASRGPFRRTLLDTFVAHRGGGDVSSYTLTGARLRQLCEAVTGASTP